MERNIKELLKIKKDVENDTFIWDLDDVVDAVWRVDGVNELKCWQNIREFSELENIFKEYQRMWGLYTAIKKCEDIEEREPFYEWAYSILKTATKEDVLEWIDDIIEELKE